MWTDRLRLNKRTILVVEHDHVIRQVLSHSLQPDYRIVEAASAEELSDSQRNTGGR
jgi:CheY-like chemotaxis protein